MTTEHHGCLIYLHIALCISSIAPILLCFSHVQAFTSCLLHWPMSSVKVWVVSPYQVPQELICAWHMADGGLARLNGKKFILEMPLRPSWHTLQSEYGINSSQLLFIYLFFFRLLLFKYSCLPFHSISATSPNHSCLPSTNLPSLALSVCPLYIMFLDGPSPIFPHYHSLSSSGHRQFVL